MPLNAEDLIPIADLVNKGRRYDQQKVSIEGEAVGDIMVRGNGSWVNVLGPDGAVIGVFCPGDLAGQVRRLGDYFHRGDMIRVSGTMYRFSPLFGGETCIVADGISVLNAGTTIAHPLAPLRIMVSIATAIGSITSVLLYRRVIRREER